MSDYEFDENSSSYDQGKTIDSDEGSRMLCQPQSVHGHLMPRENTEDASETDRAIKRQEYIEMRDKMYEEELADLKEQVRQLHARVHPEYLQRLKKLEENYNQSILMTKVFHKFALERVEHEYELERLAAHQEFDEKRIALRENLIRELEEKKKLIEAERNTMDLTSNDNLLEMTELPIMKKLINEDKSSLHAADLALIRRLVLEDLMDPKPIHTRRLRRKANDAAPVPEKKKKVAFNQLNFMLEESEIEEDLS